VAYAEKRGRSAKPWRVKYKLPSGIETSESGFETKAAALTPQAPYRLWSPMPPVYAVPLIDTARDREVDEIAAALASVGTLERRQLARLVHADLWGPGRLSSALREVVVQGKMRRTGRGLYALMPSATGPSNDSPPADDARHGDGIRERP
jgi:hypothetical protein